ncbi:competence type IV pilus major pilin ComGC [Selenomonas sp. oral taxon 149]|uniref:competence type IV pilus major pilin ComGC n=1 Tax=Selenomonas sp. oral taxon 149 TaxID=712535 RepID=UPI0001E0B7BF|nr:type II secretion system protein [Selenomonas sp. oral taxon 149]EFM22277.1 prepilin-type cleavage/methylation N-terminal domain protein [Selenomonas sp. oral taxon 149 str. 67H29BP]
MELSITNGRRTRSECGFSLLSTLLAVMILAVILAIAVPRFSSALATANTVKVQADLTALDTAIVLYQTAKGKNPEGIDDLKDYVTDLKHLKPPAGTVHAGAQELSMENVSYQVEKKDGVWRATCAGRTAEEYHTRN